MTSFSCLEIFHHAFKNQIKNDSDTLVVFVHWYLVKHGFACINEGRKTEILPENWNADEQLYLINYSCNSQGYELKVLHADDSLIVNLMKKASERTANVTCTVKHHVSSYKNEFNHMFMNLQDLYDSIDKEFGPLFKESKEEEKSTLVRDETTLRRNIEPDNRPRFNEPQAIFTQPNIPLPRPPINIGRSDLDPLRFDPTGTGGMIFDPFRNYDTRSIPTNLPRGAVPPGARFDPYGPPNPDELIPGSSTRVGPNPNHFKPPGFDDMFM